MTLAVGHGLSVHPSIPIQQKDGKPYHTLILYYILLSFYGRWTVLSLLEVLGSLWNFWFHNIETWTILRVSSSALGRFPAQDPSA